MTTISRIVICGQSLFVQAVEAGLAALAGVEVTRFHTYLPALIERILALQPDMVVIENNHIRSDLALDLVNSGLPLFVLNNEQGQGLLITGQQFSVADLTELVSYRPGFTQKI